MVVGVLAALCGSLAWTLSSSLWRSIETSLTAWQLNGLKIVIATLFLCPVLLFLPWSEQTNGLMLLMASGALGIALGDSFYFAALRRLGTRRTLTIEALGPLLASFYGMTFLAEIINLKSWFGAILVATSVVIAAFQQPPEKGVGFNRQFSSQRLGLLFALSGVICGVSGAALSRQVLLLGQITPLQSAAIRLLGGLLLIIPWLRKCIRPIPYPRPSQIRWPRILFATLLGTNLGIILQQLALQKLPLGIGVTLLSSSPVMALLLCRYEGDRLRLGGIAASFMAVFGIWLAVTS